MFMFDLCLLVHFFIDVNLTFSGDSRELLSSSIVNLDISDISEVMDMVRWGCSFMRLATR